MKMPSRGQTVYVEGYGGAVYAGGSFPEDEEGTVALKFEGVGLDEGYGRGIINISLEEFEENRVYPEQVPDGAPIVESTEKADEILQERREAYNGS